jgi:hypothetical protein
MPFASRLLESHLAPRSSEKSLRAPSRVLFQEPARDSNGCQAQIGDAKDLAGSFQRGDKPEAFVIAMEEGELVLGKMVVEVEIPVGGIEAVGTQIATKLNKEKREI